jgi:plastocyanin
MAVTLLTVTMLVLAFAASSVFADASVQIVEGSVSDINSWAFQPGDVSIPAGQAVVWSNTGSIAHTATATGGQFDTGNIAPGESKSVTLNTPGTYAYQCTPHPWMKGTVTVTAASAAPAAPAAAAPAPVAAAPGAAPAAAQAVPTPTQVRLPTPTPFRFGTTPATTTTTTTPAPRAGGVPLELIIPLLAAGSGALGGGVYILRRGRRQD